MRGGEIKHIESFLSLINEDYVYIQYMQSFLSRKSLIMILDFIRSLNVLIQVVKH
ncbi:Uncharacterised protein [Segatella copri]|nr:Uncharacterised protein [Segatella copri]